MLLVLRLVGNARGSFELAQRRSTQSIGPLGGQSVFSAQLSF